MSIHPVGEAIRILQNTRQERFQENEHADPNREVITKGLDNVDRCVRGYSKREGFCGKLSGIIYRICNAIKAIFGRSDWQIARRALKDFIIHLPKEIEGHASLSFLYVKAHPSEGNWDNFEKLLDNINMIGSRINNEDLDTILNHFIAVDENRSLRHFLAVPAVQRLIKNNLISSDIFFDLLKRLGRHTANDAKKEICNLPFYLNKLCEDSPSNRDLDYLRAAFLDENNQKRAKEIHDKKLSPEKTKAEYEAFVRSVPEFAEFIPLLNVSSKELWVELSQLFTFFTDIPFKINFEKYQCQ